jgi:hypothetical protein
MLALKIPDYDPQRPAMQLHAPKFRHLFQFLPNPPTHPFREPDCTQPYPVKQLLMQFCVTFGNQGQTLDREIA